MSSLPCCTAGSVNYRGKTAPARSTWRPRGSPLHFSCVNVVATLAVAMIIHRPCPYDFLAMTSSHSGAPGQFFFSTTSDGKPAEKGKYLYTVYSEVGHVYASFISLRLHFHYSLTAQFILSGEFGWKGKYIVVPSSEKVRKEP